MNISKYNEFIKESIEDNLYEVDNVIYFDEESYHYGY